MEKRKVWYRLAKVLPDTVKSMGAHVLLYGGIAVVIKKDTPA